jgi:hypothetical protein
MLWNTVTTVLLYGIGVLTVTTACGENKVCASRTVTAIAITTFIVSAVIPTLRLWQISGIDIYGRQTGY